nr:SIR2 family protein [Modestobacter versicolor]
MVPTDRSLRVTASWVPLLPAEALESADDDGACVAGAWAEGERVREVPGCGSRRAWLVDTVDPAGQADDDRALDWLLDGARAALAAVAAREVAEPAHGRARRLVGLPALGTGWGGAAGQRGALLQQLLPVLREAAEQHGYDIALVLRQPSDLAAAQRVRRGAGGGWALTDALRTVAEDLGDRARAGELAVFLGAGVSAAAGLPTWEELLAELAARAGLDDGLRAGLSGLPPQDAAALLARALGRDELTAYVQERFGPGPYSLAHALVAGLPVREFVTTNYDPLVELAAADIGRPLRVLPFDEAAPGAPWLLKLHGDAAHPDSVVLTREQYLEFGDHRSALAGVLQSLLLTRHVLFVGTSMLDDDLIRIAHQVRTVLHVPDTAQPRRSGTVLALREDPVRARLWERDVETVAMTGADELPDVPAAEAARRLEVLLDLVGCLSSRPTGYLLDPAYRGLLDAEETALSDALGDVAAALGAGSPQSWAAQEVLRLLRELGHAPG